MARFFQFQAKTQPTATGDQLYTPVSSWLQSWTPPPKPRIAAGLAIALIVSGVVLPPPQITSTAAIAPNTFSSEVIFPKSIIYQSKVDPVLVTETVNVDKWFESFSTPLFKKTSPANQQTLAFQFKIDELPVGGVPVYSDGPPSSFRLFQYQTIAPAPFIPEVITVDKWFSSLSDPVRTRKFPTSEQQTYTSGYLPDPSKFIEGWFNPWSDPTRIKPKVAFQQDTAWSTFTPTVSQPIPVQVDSVNEVFYKQRFIYQIDAYTPFVSTVTPAIGPTALSSEVIFPRSFIYQSVAYAPFTPAETITVDKWLEPFSEPVRKKPGLGAQQQQFYASGSIPNPATLIEGWYSPFSDPVRVKKTVPQQQDLAWSTFTPTAAAFTYFNLVQGDTGLIFQKTIIYQINTEALSPETHVFWDHPWAEPTRLKPSVASQQSSFWSTFTPTAVVTPAVTPATFSSEVIFPKSFIYQSLAWAPFTPTAVTPVVPVITDSFSEVIYKTRLIYQVDAYSPLPPTFTDVRWYSPLSEPVRTRKFPTAEQQAFTWGIFTPAAINEDDWHQAWSDPVRQKRGLQAYQQQTLAWSNFTPPFTDVRWYGSLSEPVRLKKGLGAQYQQFFTTDPTYIPAASKLPTWWYSWSEPVRKKQGLRADEQQFLSQPSLVIPPPPFVTLIEPIEPMLVYEKFFIYEPYIAPVFAQTTVTVTMFATETNSDRADFEIAVYGKAVRANVSIKEIPRADDAYASIEET